jgi:hypothetical protein
MQIKKAFALLLSPLQKRHTIVLAGNGKVGKPRCRYEI